MSNNMKLHKFMVYGLWFMAVSLTTTNYKLTTTTLKGVA